MKHGKPIVVALSGPIAAGKSTLAKFLNVQMGFTWIRTRDLLENTIISAGEDVNDKSLQEFGRKFMDDSNVQEFFDSMLRDYDPSKNYVIDSLRPISHQRFLKHRFGKKLKSLYLDSPLELRKERYLNRFGDRDKSESGFLARTSHEVENEVNLIRENSDSIIHNIDINASIVQIASLAYFWIFDQRLGFFQEMVEAVMRFHEKHDYDIDTKDMDVMPYRMGLILEELGEINECISKGKGNIAEEHADVLILLLGNCITLGIDLEKAFWKKFEIIMQRQSRIVGEQRRVSQWGQKIKYLPGYESYRFMTDFAGLLAGDEKSPDRFINPEQLSLFD